MPRLKNISVPYHSTEHTSVTLTMDFEWDSDMQGIGVVTTIFGADFTLKAGCNESDGTLMIEYNPDTYSYSFIRQPSVDMYVKMVVNGWQFRAVDKFLTWLLLRVWLKKNTLPKTRTVWHKNKPQMPPYPWEVSHDPELLYKWPKPANAKV